MNPIGVVLFTGLALANLQLAENLLTNGDGTLGDAAPSASTATENVILKRDTNLVVSGPASFSMILNRKDGNVHQALTGLAGKTVTVKAKARLEAARDGQVFMLVYDGAWKQLSGR